MNKLIFPVLFLFGFIAFTAHAGPVEETFVQEKAAQGLQILSNDQLDETQRTVEFSDFIDEVINARKISRFVLGKYARNLDKTVFTEFQHTFESYAKSMYQGNLSKFGGENIVVTGSIDRKPGDAVVSTIISGGGVEKPLKVRWRVRTKDGVSKVIDLEAFGVWLAIQQRSEITAFIANHQGDVEAATKMLHTRMAAPEPDE